MGYKVLHGVTWRYMALHIFLGCHVEILLKLETMILINPFWSGSWTRRVSVAKELGSEMFMSTHVNDIRLQPLYT
jgi:hypothetical protein